MSDDEDPFEDFEDVTDREGDPFEALDGEDGEDDTPPMPESDDGTTGISPDDPFDAASETRGAGTETEWFEGSSPGAGEPSSEPEERGDPFTETGGGGDPFSEPGERGDPFEGSESAFERMDVEGVDPDAVWEQLSKTEDRGSVADVEGKIYAEISKHSFCERCQYFSEPPEVSCSHEGTEILKFLDMDTLRVVNCPVVAERRDLEQRD
ncbi:MAG: hypothetical protein V5A39_10605 [Haloarculaceae archaeon]